MSHFVEQDRRSFLRGAAATAAGIALGHTARASHSALPGGDADGRVLVLLQLSGGNDGLATIVPGSDELRRVRPRTLHDEGDLLPLDDDRGWNPHLDRIRAEYEEGRVAIVEGCGYPDPVRSHFRSYEVWHTGRRAGRASGDGWIGRLAASTWSDSGSPDVVMHIGGDAPYSVHSSTFPPVTLGSPTGYRWFGDEESYAKGGAAIAEYATRATREPRHAGRDRALDLLRATLDDARASSQRVRGASASYRTPVEYPRTRIAASLRDVAALLARDRRTRIFSVAHSSYDTHASQRGTHDKRMRELDGALGSFLADLRRTGQSKRTVVLVFSEFGRRVAENGSGGHDHGKAGPMLLLGEAVRGGLHGAPPSLTELDDGDLAYTTDFRSVYAAIVGGWFRADVDLVLGPEAPPALELV